MDTGWAGRMADLIRVNVANQQLATNVSLNGNTLFMSGDDTVSYSMGATGPLAFSGFTAGLAASNGVRSSASSAQITARCMCADSRKCNGAQSKQPIA